MTTTVLPRPAPSQTLAARRAAAGDHPRRLLRAMRGRVVRRTLPLGIVLLALMLVHVWVAHQVEDVGKQLWNAHNLQARLEQTRAELIVERETYSDHTRIGQYAREKLGLVEPRQNQIVTVR